MKVLVYTVEMRLADNRILIDDLKFLKGDAIAEAAKRGRPWKVSQIEVDMPLDKIKQLSFFEWLAVMHPHIHLTTLQKEWVAAQERGENLAMMGGRVLGRTFIFNLYKEYLEGKDA